MTATVRNCLAYGSDGRVMAIAQEYELLVYSGADESPLRRGQCAAPIVSVSVQSQFVFALDREGQLNRWDAVTGESRQTVSTTSPALGMTVAANCDCAVLSNAGISLIRDSNVIQVLPLTSITAVQWSGNDLQLACGGSNGRLSVYQRGCPQETLATEPVGRIYLMEPIVSIASSQEGSWIASAGSAVWQLNPQRALSSNLMQDTRHPTQTVALSQDGRLLAFMVGDHDIVALHMNPCALAGTISYQDRVVTGLAFGMNSKLGIGLDTGDGNIFDFSKPQGRVARTDPHPGHPHNQWLLNVQTLPRPQEVAGDATKVGPGVNKDAFPGWAGPIVGAIIGLIIGLQLSRDQKPDAAIVTITTGIVLGLAGGGVMWLMDRLKKR